MKIYKIEPSDNIIELEVIRETKTLYVLNNGTRLRKKDLTDLAYKWDSYYYTDIYKKELSENDLIANEDIMNLAEELLNKIKKG